MAKKPNPAILPGSTLDPTGVDSLERKAIKDFKRRMRKVAQAYKAALRRVPYTMVVNARYAFSLDASLLRALMDQLDLEVDALLMEGGPDNLWFFRQYVAVAAARGTAQSFANLANQSARYKAGRESVQSILSSEPYRRRMALVRAREFEEMKGLSGDVKASMARVLTDGLGRGRNPREIATALEEQAGIEMRRANRIARTEVTTALRRARWDEADEAEELYAVMTRELHLSALSATTRASHAARHGNVYTRDQVREFYSKDGNSINCKCSTTSILVDDKGKPLVTSTIERAKASKEAMESRGYAWAED